MKLVDLSLSLDLVDYLKLLLQAIAEQSRIVRLPLNQVGSLNKINREINKFA